MRYLLDTNVVSDLVRNRREKWRRASARLAKGKFVPASLSPPNCVTGCQEGLATALVPAEIVLGALEVLPFETPADAAYGLLRTRLEQAGTANRRQRSAYCGPSACTWFTIVTDNEK